MEIELSTKELELLIKSYLGKFVWVKYLAPDKLEVHYKKRIKLRLWELGPTSIQFLYDAGFGVDVLAAVTKPFLYGKLRKLPIEWSVWDKSITIELSKVPALQPLLEVFYLSGAMIRDHKIYIEFAPKK